jgi:integrase
MLTSFLHLAGRRNEIFGLKLVDLDFPNSKVRLWTRKQENGNLEEDWLPMTKELKAVLLKWLEIRMGIKGIDPKHVFICFDKTPFCDQYFGKPFKKRQHFMKRLCEKAKVKPFGFHAIRHLTATILYHKGYKVSHIQAVLRHKSAQTTERYLKSLGLEFVREVLDEGLKGPAEIILFKKQLPSDERI